MSRLGGMRPRIHKGLETNLFPLSKKTKGGIVTYYRYRHPYKKDAKGRPVEFAFGKDRKEANKAARIANNRLVEEVNLADLVTGNAGLTISQTIDRFIKEYPKLQSWAASTKKEHLRRLEKYKSDIGHHPITIYTMQEMSDYLDGYQGDGRKQCRNLLIHLYRFAVSKGIVPVNLAENTLATPAQKRQRGRMSLEQYRKIHANAPAWLQNAMDIALITLQGRNEITNMKFTDIKGDHLYVIRQKTKEHTEHAYLEIGIGKELEKVIKRCRGLAISKYIIHRRTKQVSNDVLTRSFKTVRDNVFPKLKNPPTFHEIRSLGGRLYLEQGYPKEYVQALMGHATVGMTDVYLTDDEIRYKPCAADLKL